MKQHIWIVIGLLLIGEVLPYAQVAKEELTLEKIYHPKEQLDVSPELPTVKWLENNFFLQVKDGQVQKVHALTGESQRLFSAKELEQALSQVAGVSQEEAASMSRPHLPLLNPQQNAFLLFQQSDIFLYSLKTNKARRLTNSLAKEKEAEFSPDGKWVSFVRNNDLFVAHTLSGEIRELTEDGSPLVLNGVLDWVYQEEIYGRGNFRGYWWSPDSSKIAFLQLREENVTTTTLLDQTLYRQRKEQQYYPRAGEVNPQVSLAVVDIHSGETTWIPQYDYQGQDFLIVDVAWKDNSPFLTYQIQNRQQTWLDLNLVDSRTGKVTRILREVSPAWVMKQDSPYWIDQERFLWLSERSGQRHLYLYHQRGELIKQVTQGSWEIKQFCGYHPHKREVYFTANEHSFIENHLYRTPLNGRVLSRITRKAGNHHVRFSPAMDCYLDYWSDLDHPTQLTLHLATGEKLKELSPIVNIRERFELGKTQFYQVPTQDGFQMEALMIVPSDFDPHKKYPVLYYVYGGPQAATVRNRWGGKNLLWHHYLAQKGYIIWLCDNRSASDKGVQPAWSAYRQLGKQELKDIDDSISWLKQKKYVDPKRIGIWGWSYGGYLTCYALTNSQLFKMGIAGAPVTDWRNYDSIYTERYMDTPEHNPAGYLQSSPVQQAEHLTGDLLLIHGTLDDNVHPQNTLQLSYALQKAGKLFSLMLYPRSQHGLSDPRQIWHLRKMMVDFIFLHL